MAIAPPPLPAPEPLASAEAKDLQTVLLTREDLARRVADLGAAISTDYRGRSLVVVGVLKGCIVFLADLIREITIPIQFDLAGAESYKGGTRPTPNVRITKDLEVDLSGRDVLLVEDIYDSGHTLHVVHDMIKLHQPASLEICTLLYKKRERTHEVPVKYKGFEIEDVFVVGYGLDYKERYRGLPCIGVLKPEVYG